MDAAASIHLVVYGPTYYDSCIQAAFRSQAEAEEWLAGQRRAADYGQGDWESFSRMRVVSVPLVAHQQPQTQTAPGSD